MNNETLLLLLVLAVGMIALALLAQALVLFGIYKKSKELHTKLNDFLPKAEALIKTTEASMVELTQSIAEITGRANDILDSAKSQMARMDLVITDATDRAKVQMEKAELVIGDTLDRIHNTVLMVHKSVLTPLREITGVSAGLRAAFSAMFSPQRRTVTQVTQDEEMFI